LAFLVAVRLNQCYRMNTWSEKYRGVERLSVLSWWADEEGKKIDAQRIAQRDKGRNGIQLLLSLVGMMLCFFLARQIFLGRLGLYQPLFYCTRIILCCRNRRAFAFAVSSVAATSSSRMQNDLSF
jgi:hypothetical protein